MTPDEGVKSQVIGSLSSLLPLPFEPVGRWFEAHYRRSHSQHSQSQHSLNSSSSESETEEEEDLFDEEDEAALNTLMKLDPKEWKKQDHYAVLGLSKLRYKASEDQIKRAYKQKVLTHHPDKRKARGKVVKEGDDDYFTCITKAYEILGNKQKRRSFDSVDPEFEDSVPKESTKENFYQVFRPVFESNARWSLKKRVPKLGDESMAFEDVDHFYSFWYEFDSWREFSYLDEEEKEKGENREERRWIEKQNKAARQKLKKEETVRLRQLVDNAYANDPRILKHREEEKERKLAMKKAKQDAARQRAEDEERRKQEALDGERKKKEKEEEEAKAQAAKIRKEETDKKRQLKKERKTMMTLVKKYDYFTEEGDERVKMLLEVDKVSELLSLTSLISLNESMSTVGKEGAKDAFMERVTEVNDKMAEEKRQQMEQLSQKSGSDNSTHSKSWSEAETQVLIKGVNLFPAGTQDRWEVIAKFITQHVTKSNKTAKDVLSKAKDLQKNDMRLKEEAKKNAYSKFEQQHKAAKSGDMDAPSQRLETVGEQQVRETGSNQAVWTAEEQKLLEQALKSYPATDSDRWERIAAVIPSRSKKDCMRRYKELCELVKAKKQAQTAVASKAKKS